MSRLARGVQVSGLARGVQVSSFAKGVGVTCQGCWCLNTSTHK